MGRQKDCIKYERMVNSLILLKITVLKDLFGVLI